MIEKLRQEARETVLDYFTDLVLFATVQPKISDFQTRLNQTEKTISDGTNNLRVTKQNLETVSAELAELNRKLSANNQPNREPAIQAQIATKETKIANLETAISNHEAQLETAREMNLEVRQNLVSLRQVTKPKPPLGLS